MFSSQIVPIITAIVILIVIGLTIAVFFTEYEVAKWLHLSSVILLVITIGVHMVSSFKMKSNMSQSESELDKKLQELRHKYNTDQSACQAVMGESARHIQTIKDLNNQIKSLKDKLSDAEMRTTSMSSARSSSESSGMYPIPLPPSTNVNDDQYSSVDTNLTKEQKRMSDDYKEINPLDKPYGSLPSTETLAKMAQKK